VAGQVVEQQHCAFRLRVRGVAVHGTRTPTHAPLRTAVSLREYRPDLSADSPDLDAIAEELGDLPLALDLAGRYLDKYRHEVTPAAYLADIRRPEILEHPSLRRARGISPTKHDMDVWRTFALSYWRFDADDETDGTAVRLLARAAG
jgi:hypothetical protein